MSRSAHTRVACFAVIACCSVWLSGCERPAGELSSGLQKEGHSATISAPNQKDLPRVAPGTLLSESNFSQTLLATGAEFVVVQVYAEACGPCITEALKLTQLEKQWHSQGIAILGLGMDETSAGPKSFFDSTGGRVEFPLYLAPWFAKQQQVEATPALFIYSADGEQLHRYDSKKADISAVEEISEKLAELLAER